MNRLAAHFVFLAALLLLATGSHAWSLEEFITDPKWAPLLRQVHGMTERHAWLADGGGHWEANHRWSLLNHPIHSPAAVLNHRELPHG